MNCAPSFRSFSCHGDVTFTRAKCSSGSVIVINTHLETGELIQKRINLLFKLNINLCVLADAVNYVVFSIMLGKNVLFEKPFHLMILSIQTESA